MRTDGTSAPVERVFVDNCYGARDADPHVISAAEQQRHDDVIASGDETGHDVGHVGRLDIDLGVSDEHVGTSLLHGRNEIEHHLTAGLAVRAVRREEERATRVRMSNLKRRVPRADSPA